MHLRYTRALGTPVIDSESLQVLGTVSGILLHPDTGKVEGLFVTVPGFFSRTQLFLSSMDILRWASRIELAHGDVLAPVEDHVRLQPLLEEGRPMLGQPIRTDAGRAIGRCADVQFDTKALVIEWLFPRSLFRWGRPLPVSLILEVRREAIIIRDPDQPAAEKAEPVPILHQMPNAA